MKIEVGERLTYHPPQKADENLHPIVEVVAIGKRIKVRAFTEEHPEWRLIYVSARRLTRQADLLVVA